MFFFYSSIKLYYYLFESRLVQRDSLPVASVYMVDCFPVIYSELLAPPFFLFSLFLSSIAIPIAVIASNGRSLSR